MLETEVQSNLKEYLQLLGFFVYKNHLGGIPTSRGTAKNPSKGLADLTSIRNGIVIQWEIKRGKDSGRKTNQNEFQIAFMEKWREKGGYWFCVRTIEDINKAIEEIKQAPIK